MLNNSAFRKLSGQETDGTNLELVQMGCAPEMMNVINAQQILIAKLLQRQDLLQKELSKRSTSSGSCSGSGDSFGIREQLARFGDFIQQDGTLEGSQLEASGSEVKNQVNIIQGERHLLLNTPRKKVFVEYSSYNICSDD